MFLFSSNFSYITMSFSVTLIDAFFLVTQNIEIFISDESISNGSSPNFAFNFKQI